VVVPVDRQTEPLQESFEDLFVDLDEFVAEFEEVRARDGDRVVVLGRIPAERRFESLDVVLGGVAPHAVVVLHATLGGQAVVVPAHRVEDRLAAHALVAGDDVGVGVAEHVAHVQRAAHGGRRRVDGEHALAIYRRVETVRAIGVPLGGPAVLDAVERRLVGDVRHRTPRLPTRPHPLPSTFAYGSGWPVPPEMQRKSVGGLRRLDRCAAPVRHRHAIRARAGAPRARNGEHLPVRPHGVRAPAPRPRPRHARVRHPAPLPRVEGLDVRLVSNITDIEDKIIERALREDRPWQDITTQVRGVWFEAMDGIGVERPTDVPRATEYVEQMVTMIGPHRVRARLRHRRRRLPGGRVGRRLRAARPPVARRDAARAAATVRWSVPRTSGPGRLRPVEVRQAGRAGVAVAVG
jgi:hypothetical protein